MKKVSLICFVAAICYLTSVVSAYAGWPINRTLPIEGRVTDATTGEPIENVIISCEWWKDVFGIVDTLQQTFSEKLVVTGKNGRYKIPAKISLHIISRFKRVEISVRHPLYEMKEFWAWNKGMYVRKGEWVEAKDGKIYLDIKLLSLEEKYREIKNLTDEERILLRRYQELKRKYVWRLVSNLQREEIAKIERDFEEFRIKNKKIEKISDLITDFKVADEMPKYCAYARKLGIETNWEDIFNRWEKIVEPFGGNLSLVKSRIYEIVQMDEKKFRRLFK